MKRRIVIYTAGMAVLAFGIILNTKTGLGVTPVIQPAFVVSVIMERSFGNIALIWYAIMIAMEVLIHISMGGDGLKRIVLKDVLQFPVIILFTRLMNIFSMWIPALPDDNVYAMGPTLALRVLMLIVAVICTGVGAAMSLDMRLLPSPADGLVQAISDKTGKSLGFVKNIFDASCLILGAAISLACGRGLIGIGIGTLVAAIGIGRTIAVYHKLHILELK